MSGKTKSSRKTYCNLCGGGDAVQIPCNYCRGRNQDARVVHTLCNECFLKGCPAAYPRVVDRKDGIIVIPREFWLDLAER